MPPLLPLLRALKNATAFLLALAGGCAALRAWAPMPAIPQVSAKLAHFAKEAPPCNVLFFGSSKIYSGLIPELFDARPREGGAPFRSFNFGVDGMGFPESAYLCEQALRLRPGEVWAVFIELAGLRTTIPAGQRGTQRSVYWHDARRTLAVCRQILANRAAGRGDLTAVEARELLRTHLSLWARRFANLGNGAQVLGGALSGAPPPAPTGRDAFDPSARGYLPIRTGISGKAAEEYRRGLEKFAATRSAPDAGYEEALRDFARRVRAHGATAFFIVAPNPTPSRSFFPAAEEAPPVFAFDDPALFPALYDPMQRGDAVHLNDAGAQNWTRLLAERFAQFLAEKAAAR